MKRKFFPMTIKNGKPTKKQLNDVNNDFLCLSAFRLVEGGLLAFESSRDAEIWDNQR